jgi:hypothetical protein
VTAAHALAALIALGAAGLLLVAGAVAAWRDVAHAWIHRLGLAVTGVFAIQAGIGLLLLAMGKQPMEWLHLLYGAVLVGAIPFGLSFASEAPARDRSGVVAAAAGVALLIVWRLFATG